MKVLHLGYSDQGGGGFAAPVRLCKAQRDAGIDAWYGVVEKKTANEFVIQLPKKNSFLFKVFKKFKNKFDEMVKGLTRSNNPIMQSINDFSLVDVEFINSSDYDIIQMHWVNHNMISIKDLSKIKKKIIFTLHDNWFFCGTEHYINVLEGDTRYLDGYKIKPKWHQGYDLPKKVFNKKLKHFQKIRPLIVNPSNWQDNLYKSSYFKSKLQFTSKVVPNITPEMTFRSMDKQKARSLLGLPDDSLIISFGSAYEYTTSVNIKGSHLLVPIFKELEKLISQPIHLIAFGPASPSLLSQIHYPVFFTGQVSNDTLMNLIYNCCDIFLCPSLLENLPLTILEANFCQVPTVAFDASGTTDLIEHKKTGYLARAYDVADFAQGIKFCAENLAGFSSELRKLNSGAFSTDSIIKQYRELYLSCMQ